MAFENPFGFTPEQLLGFDGPRFYGNGVQVFPTPDMSFLVFREQISLAEEGAEADSKVFARNVLTMALPTPVLIQLRDILNTVIHVEGEAPADGVQ